MATPGASRSRPPRRELRPAVVLARRAARPIAARRRRRTWQTPGVRSPRIQGLVAILLGTVVIHAPDTVRGGPTVTEVVAALIWVSVDGWLLAVALRWGQRRAIPTAWTLAAGYCAVLVFGAIWLEAVIASGLVAEKNAASRKLHGILADGAGSVLRTHRNWLVAPAHVRELVRASGELAVIVGPDLAVPVSRDRGPAVRAALTAGALGARR
jgi:LytTr DNA-binding domain